MVSAIPAVSQLPVSLTTSPNTRPVSVRTAQENEIDQINNTPSAKRLYNAKLIGGAIGAAAPLALSAVVLLKTKNVFKEAAVLKGVMRTAIAAAGVYLAVHAAKAGTAISKTLTIFASTRGENKVK